MRPKQSTNGRFSVHKWSSVPIILALRLVMPISYPPLLPLSSPKPFFSFHCAWFMYLSYKVSSSKEVRSLRGLLDLLNGFWDYDQLHHQISVTDLQLILQFLFSSSEFLPLQYLTLTSPLRSISWEGKRQKIHQVREDLHTLTAHFSIMIYEMLQLFQVNSVFYLLPFQLEHQQCRSSVAHDPLKEW